MRLAGPIEVGQRPDVVSANTSFSCGNCHLVHNHQIYEGTNQIQRMVMARQLLKG